MQSPPSVYLLCFNPRCCPLSWKAGHTGSSACCPTKTSGSFSAKLFPKQSVPSLYLGKDFFLPKWRNLFVLIEFCKFLSGPELHPAWVLLEGCLALELISSLPILLVQFLLQTWQVCSVVSPRSLIPILDRMGPCISFSNHLIHCLYWTKTRCMWYYLNGRMSFYSYVSYSSQLVFVLIFFSCNIGSLFWLFWHWSCQVFMFLLLLSAIN